MENEFNLLKGYQYIFIALHLSPYILIAIYFGAHAYFDYFGICLLLPTVLFIIVGIITNFRNELVYPYRRITISEQGIEYEKPYLAFKAKWDSVERINKRWTFLGRLDGLIVEQSKIEFTKGNNAELLSLFRKAFIPLSCFSKNWRDSELGQQIKQYAPHLFETAGD